MSDFIFNLVIVNVVIILYIYIGYPLLLIFLLFLKKVFVRSDFNQKTEINTLKVTVLISCFNEVKVIQDKIDNCLALDYPSELIDFIFISDGSFDGTDKVIENATDDKVKFIRQERRQGKSAALNLALPLITGDIIVFSDANAMYDPSAIFHLTQRFNDPEVGYVVGTSLYFKNNENPVAISEKTYWKYELFIKALESDLSSVVGGDGAIYGIRSHLFFPFDKEDISDFVNPLQIIIKGFRGVYSPDAICFENASDTFLKEAERKKRIVNQSFIGLLKFKEVMNPFKYGLFSLFVVSHKLLRWLTSLFVVLIAFGTIYLAKSEFVLFQVFALMGIVLFWLCLIGYIKSNSEKVSPLFYYPYYFLMVNMYVTLGMVKAIMGNIQYSWNTVRTEIENNDNSNKIRVTRFLIAFSLSFILFIDILLETFW